jgi:hypothetical protein
MKAGMVLFSALSGPNRESGAGTAGPSPTGNNIACREHAEERHAERECHMQCDVTNKKSRAARRDIMSGR